MSKIINLFGGPGIGKSTQAAELYTIMKKNHLNVELTYEFPKIVSWEENFSAIKDQLYITANQHRNISRLYGKVDFIIVDSPIILGSVYKDVYSDEKCFIKNLYDESFDNFILGLFKKYDNINILLKRNECDYDETGRLQNAEEAKLLDNKIKQTLLDNDISFIEFDVNNNTSTNIFKYLKENAIN